MWCQGLCTGLERGSTLSAWGKNPDPQNNISGPYEVLIEKGGRIEQVIPVNAFDMIDT